MNKYEETQDLIDLIAGWVVAILLGLFFYFALSSMPSESSQDCTPGGASYVMPVGDTFTTITVPDCQE